MNGKQMLAGAIGSMLLAVIAQPVMAGSKSLHHDSHGKRYVHFQKSAPSIGYTSPVRRLHGVGTFSRSVWAISSTESASAREPAPRATIIEVDDYYFNRFDPCSYEERVCVIRGGR